MIPLAFGLSLAGLLKSSDRGYGLAGAIISGATGALALSLLAVGFVMSVCS